MKSNFQLFLKVCLALFLMLMILEIGLRYTGKLKTYSEKTFDVYQSPYESNERSHLFIETPNDTIVAQQKEFFYTYYLNELGLYDKNNLNSLDKKNTFIYLGDSFTFGAGAPQDSSLPVLLSHLNNCTFINAGFSGSDPFYENMLIDSIFKPEGFHNYIMMLNVSDLYDYIFRGGEERFLPNGKIQYHTAPWWENLHQHCYIVRAFVHGVLKMDFTLLPPKIMKQKKLEAIEVYSNLLININSKLNGNLIVVLQPYARQYSSGFSVLNEVMEFSYLNELSRNLQNNNITTINLDKALAARINQSNYLNYSWKIDGHYNSKGYLLLAETLAAELNKMKICSNITKDF